RNNDRGGRVGPDRVDGAAPGNHPSVTAAGLDDSRIPFFVSGILLQVRVEGDHVGDARSRPGPGFRVVGAARKVRVAAVIAVQRQAELFEVVLAADAVGRLAHFLYGGDQQAEQDADDADNHEQLDQGKSRTPRA